VTVSLDDVGVDVWEFEALAGKHDTDALERAAQLYRGDLLEGVTRRTAQRRGIRRLDALCRSRASRPRRERSAEGRAGL